MSKKDTNKSGDKEIKETKTPKINDGKCCRCVSYTKEHKCRCRKSQKNGKYTPRKFGCECFKYAN